MNREDLFALLGELDDQLVAEAVRYRPGDAAAPSERNRPMKRIATIALAAALLLALGAAAYAVWSIHASRQQELKTDLRIEESGVDSYVEFTVPEGQTQGLVLLSTVNDGTEQHVYLNISPVSEQEILRFPEELRFAWSIPGTEYGGFAAPQLPAELSVSGAEAISRAVRQYAYDAPSQTVTLHCLLDVEMVSGAMAQLGRPSVPLEIRMAVGDGEPSVFGPVDVTLTEVQRRSFDFGPVLYHDAELDRDIEIVALELTPFGAVWKVRYEGAESFHTPEADWEAYAPWSALEDKVCIESRLVFSDGSSFSTGGALTCPYEDGTVNLWCGWGSAIDINDVQRIVLGDTVLWER